MKLTIVTVCRNEKGRIKDTLESVAVQSFKDFEYILIDGASTDGTLVEIEPYKKILSHFISEPDGGVYSAMNKGITLAQGEYILFLNGGDCLVSKDVLEQVFSLLPTEEILLGDLRLVRGERRTTVCLPTHLDAQFWAMSSPFHPSAFIKRTLFSRFGPYNLKYKIAADYEFFLRSAVVNRASVRPLRMVISEFEANSGLSSLPENWRKIQIERVHAQLSNKQWFILSLVLLRKLIDKISLLLKLRKKNAPL